VVKRWRKRLCKKVKSETVPDAEKIEGAVRKLVTIVDKELLGAALEDAQHRSLRICEQEKDGTIRGTEATGEFERYTPPEFIEAARKVLGGFDLDPASCEMAQATVQADNYYTAESNGLTHEWHGRIWLNPPYHRELGPLFIAKLVGEYEAGRVTAAIVLTNNCTDTEWCARIGPACTAICFPTGRIRFTTDKGKEVLPTQGQTFFYFGDDPQRFREVFRKIGWGVSPVWSFEEK
jgi:hypothetical protein